MAASGELADFKQSVGGGGRDCSCRLAPAKDHSDVEWQRLWPRGSRVAVDVEKGSRSCMGERENGKAGAGTVWRRGQL
jgi:hypothetical protein